MKFKNALTIVCLFAVFTLASAYAQDRWNGGTGNWSSPGSWSGGLPGSNSDVLIYSGGNDDVTLDASPSINSLTLGGSQNGTDSGLSNSDGTARSLTIAESLTVGQTGSLVIYNGSVVTAGADSSNAGILDIFSSAFRVNGNFNNSNNFLSTSGGNININGTLTNSGDFESQGINMAITGNLDNTGTFFVLSDTVSVGGLSNSGSLTVWSDSKMNVLSGGVTDVVFGSYYDIEGTLTGAFNNLSSIEGTLNLNSPQTTTITPGGAGLTNTGTFNVGGSLVVINGNVNNSGDVTMWQLNGGQLGATLNVTGTLTNTQNGRFEVDDVRVANISTLTNDGTVCVGCYSFGGTLNVGTLTNNQNGSFYLFRNGVANVNTMVNNGDVWIGGDGPAILNVTGTLTNNGDMEVGPNGQPDDVLNAGTVRNNGVIDLNYGALNVKSLLVNNGVIACCASFGAKTMQVGTGLPGAKGYYQFANGTLGEVINANSFGVVEGFEMVTLDGALDVMLQPGFNPKVGSTFEFMQFYPGELNGEFSNVQNYIFNNGTERWIVVYDNADGYVALEAAPVPEPGSLLLLGSGLLTMGCGVRRRLKNQGSLSSGR